MASEVSDDADADAESTSVRILARAGEVTGVDVNTGDRGNDVESDLAAHVARELSLSLQNQRLKGLIKQASVSPPSVSPRSLSPRPSLAGAQHVNCLSVGRTRGGKILFGIQLMTILPSQVSFSVAEYIGYRMTALSESSKPHFGDTAPGSSPPRAWSLPLSQQHDADGPITITPWERSKSLLRTFFGAQNPADCASMAAEACGPGTRAVAWELLWKQSVGQGNLRRLALTTTEEEFRRFEAVVIDWAAASMANDFWDGQSPGLNAGSSSGSGTGSAHVAKVPSPRGGSTARLEATSLTPDYPHQGSNQSQRKADLPPAAESKVTSVAAQGEEEQPDDEAEDGGESTRLSDASLDPLERERLNLQPTSDASAVSACAPGKEDEVLQPHSRRRMQRVASESNLIVQQHVEALTEALPERFRHHTWGLAYSTKRDGISLQTLYRRVRGDAPTILVVEDSDGYLFGVFASEAWKVHERFYGTGETFVFQLKPEVRTWRWNQEAHCQEHRNNFFMFSTHDCIACGGGGHFALWLDEDLLYGNSSCSATFNNDGLSGKENFEVLAVEVWRLQ